VRGDRAQPRRERHRRQQRRTCPRVKPEDTEAPRVEVPQASGIAAAGQQLTCVRGTWNGQPPPTFTYQWLRDGASIASATSNTYMAELADKATSCRATSRRLTAKVALKPRAATALKSCADARRERARSDTAVRRHPGAQCRECSPFCVRNWRACSTARGSPRFAGAGSTRSRCRTGPRHLELVWYQTAQGARHSQSTKPLVVALSTTAYASAGTKSGQPAPDERGATRDAHSSSLELTLKGVFVQPQGRPLVWLKTVVLHY